MCYYEEVWLRDDGEGYPEFTSETDKAGSKFVRAKPYKAHAVLSSSTALLATICDADGPAV